MKLTRTQLKEIIREELQRLSEYSTEKNLDKNDTIVVQGVKGMNSKSFTKKFKNYRAFEKWADSPTANDYEIQYISNG